MKRLPAIALTAILAFVSQPTMAQTAGEETSTAAATLDLGLNRPLTAEEEKRRAALEAQYNQINQESGLEERVNGESTVRDPGGVLPNLGGLILQMILVLGAVCLLAYLILGKLLPKILRVEQPKAKHRILEVVDRLAIDQRRAIMVLKMHEQYFLVGVTEQGITLLARLEDDDVQAALLEAEERAPAFRGLTSLLMGKSQKEG